MRTLKPTIRTNLAIDAQINLAHPVRMSSEFSYANWGKSSG